MKKHPLESIAENWDIPAYRLIELHPRTSRHCIVTAVWNEGEKSYQQYRNMLPYTRSTDFIVASRGNDFTQLPKSVLSNEFNIRCLLNVSEPGQSTAYRAALAYALCEGYSGIVMIDSNGKDGVNKIPEFCRFLDLGYDLVQGSRYVQGGVHKNTPLLRTFSVRLVAPFILWCGSGYWYTDQNNGFKGFSRAFLLDPRVQPFRKVFKFYNLQVYLNYIAAKLNFKIIEVPTSRTYPASGPLVSKLTSPTQLWKHLCDYIYTSFGRYNP